MHMNKQPPAGSDEISTHHKSSWASTWTAQPKLQRNCKGDPCNPLGPSEAFVDYHQEIQDFWVGRLCTVSTFVSSFLCSFCNRFVGVRIAENTNRGFVYP